MEKELLRGVITFNYDTSLEFLSLNVSGLGQFFYYPGLSNQDASRKLPLFKLHGSLNWQTDSTNNHEPIKALEPSTNIAEMNHGYGWYRRPEVVGPTFFKQEITLDFEILGDFRAPFYKLLWRNAWDTLRNVRNLIFVGFSFPQTDFHARALFCTAHLNGNGFRHVVLCHRGNQDLRNAAEQVFRGRPTKFTEFTGGLENMTERIDEVIALLH